MPDVLIGTIGFFLGIALVSVILLIELCLVSKGTSIVKTVNAPCSVISGQRELFYRPQRT
jgi:hypothetical protein